MEVTQIFMLFVMSFGSQLHVVSMLECSCNTAECSKSNKMVCTAKNTCYVQTMYVQQDAQSGEYTKDAHEQILRGCIDDVRPLLCENRRPEGYAGPWPVLHCCQQDWCNRDIMPTDPPWLVVEKEQMLKDMQYSNKRKKQRKDKTPEETNNYYYQSETSQENQNGRHNDRFNVLYIAVPLAGACVVLALVIFSLYLLKVNRQHVKKQQHHSCHSKASGGGGHSADHVIITNSKQTPHGHQQLHHQQQIYQHPHKLNRPISSVYQQKLPLMIEVNNHKYCCSSSNSKPVYTPPVHREKFSLQYGGPNHHHLHLQEDCNIKSCEPLPPSYVSSSCDSSVKSGDKSCDCCESLVGSETKLLV